MVSGITTTQYIQNCLESCHCSSPKVKNVVLNSAYHKWNLACEQRKGFGVHSGVIVAPTETKVAGRTVIVRRAIDFMTVLSWLAIMLNACIAVLLANQPASSSREGLLKRLPD